MFLQDRDVQTCAGFACRRLRRNKFGACLWTEQGVSLCRVYDRRAKRASVTDDEKNVSGRRNLKDELVHRHCLDTRRRRRRHFRDHGLRQLMLHPEDARPTKRASVGQLALRRF